MRSQIPVVFLCPDSRNRIMFIFMRNACRNGSRMKQVRHVSEVDAARIAVHIDAIFGMVINVREQLQLVLVMIMCPDPGVDFTTKRPSLGIVVRTFGMKQSNNATLGL